MTDVTSESYDYSRIPLYKYRENTVSHSLSNKRNFMYGDICGIIRLVAVVCIICGVSAEVIAQDEVRARTVYLSSRVGLTLYDGDLNEQISPAFNEPSGSSLGLGMEVGYHINDYLSAGLNFKYANYPFVALEPPFVPRDANDHTAYTRRHSVQTLVRFRLPVAGAPIAPYAHAGIHFTRGGYTPASISDTGETENHTAYGPLMGVGLEVQVIPQFSVFVEATGNLSFPDRAFDGWDGPNSTLDGFGFVGVGFRVDMGRPHMPIFVTAAGPASVRTGEDVTFEAVVRERSAPPEEFVWEFSDGTRLQGPLVTHVFDTPGTYDVELVASHGRSQHSDIIRIDVVSAGDEPVAAEVPERTEASAEAEAECARALDEAERVYVEGSFEEAINMVEVCHSFIGIRTGLRVRAFRQQSLAQASMGNNAAARQTIESLLDIDPNYVPNPVQDPPSFSSLVALVRQQRVTLSQPSRLDLPGSENRDDSDSRDNRVSRDDYVLPAQVLERAEELGLSSLQIEEIEAVEELIEDMERPLLASISDLTDDESSETPGTGSSNGSQLEINRINSQLRALYQNAEYQVLQVLTSSQAEQMESLR